MRRCHIDYETCSPVDLPAAGASRYSRHPETRVLMCAYAFDDGPVKQWVPAEGEAIPEDFEDAIEDPEIVKYAWNAPFEMAITEHVLEVPVDVREWRDVMVMSLYCSLPAKLEKCGPIIRLPPELLKMSGKRLINLFSSGQKHWTEEPLKWEEFKEYNVGDVESERGIYHRLRKFDLPDYEWEAWFLDYEINQRGIPIAVERCKNVVKAKDVLVTRYLKEMKEITGLQNPNSRDQLLGWLKENGYRYEDLKAAHIEQAIEAFEEEQRWDDEIPF